MQSRETVDIDLKTKGIYLDSGFKKLFEAAIMNQTYARSLFNLGCQERFEAGIMSLALVEFLCSLK